MFGHVNHPFFLLSWQTVQFVDRDGKGTAETEAAEVISACMKRFRYQVGQVFPEDTDQFGAVMVGI